MLKNISIDSSQKLHVPPSLEFRQGNILKVGFQDATHLYMANLVWGHELINSIILLAKHAPRLRCIISLKKLSEESLALQEWAGSEPQMVEARSQCTWEKKCRLRYYCKGYERKQWEEGWLQLPTPIEEAYTCIAVTIFVCAVHLALLHVSSTLHGTSKSGGQGTTYFAHVEAEDMGDIIGRAYGPAYVPGDTQEQSCE
eukprot:gnl/MRDRNA2_/MRDRNA2_283522_c0_seq1.p1 gnl/MRDRNA2_/MRDRNA2_283522_c0~~gnl/MRDRNA2_/MRDRNA2_283522_c0_seq1.p1  ORF type:complete len:199 (-),score=24.91 gnl/MRDRNA2_/MRDRNA2_283522_c0_seq1:80-676(-)